MSDEQRTDSPRIDHCLVIGGGPAGLTCALYLARFNCRTTVLFREDQRARTIPRTWNFPGHPEGLQGEEIVARCKEHAAKYGAGLVHGEVESVEGRMGSFRARLAGGQTYEAGCIVFATGVRDVPPDFPHADRYVGRGLRHCPICDGYEANGLRLALFGTGDGVARHALYMTTFSERLTILLNGEGRAVDIDAKLLEQLGRRRIPVLEPRVVEVFDEGAELRGFRLEDGSLIEIDRAYSAIPVQPRSELARSLGVALDPQGFIQVDANGRTNIEGVYAVGDVVNVDYAQVVIGMGQGATAAIDIQARYRVPG